MKAWELSPARHFKGLRREMGDFQQEKWMIFSRRLCQGFVFIGTDTTEELGQMHMGYIQKAWGGSIRSPNSLTWLDVLVTPMFTITMFSSFVDCMEGLSSKIKTAALLYRQCRVTPSSHTGKALVIQGHKLNKTNLGPTCFSSSSL